MKAKRRTNSKETGITLVALIITIIVLIILAAVTINSIVQMNMIEKALGAAEGYEEEQQREDNMMSSIDTMIAELGNDTDSTPNVGKEYEEQGTINGKQGTYQNPTIPKGYYPINTETAKWDRKSGPEYDNGLVITDELDSEGNSIGNEWVWVPVQNPSEMYEEVEEGIAITGGAANVISNVSTKRYSKSGILSGKIRVLPNDTSNYREPDMVVGNGTQYDAVEANWTKVGFSSLENMASTLVSEYSTMIDSVRKYGGFYLGRYELTEEGEKPGTPLININWYDLYAKCKLLSKSGSNTMTRMVWGCEWDITCKWLGKKYNIENSTNWGNYYETSVTANDGITIIKSANTAEKLDTGITTYTMANNLYDLAGNVYEWTQEACENAFRPVRGGSYMYYNNVSTRETADAMSSPSGAMPDRTGNDVRHKTYFNFKSLNELEYCK